MRSLREHKDSVMAVLEAFVYDPLLNWRLMDSKYQTMPGCFLVCPSFLHCMTLDGYLMLCQCPCVILSLCLACLFHFVFRSVAVSFGLCQCLAVNISFLWSCFPHFLCLCDVAKRN